MTTIPSKLLALNLLTWTLLMKIDIVNENDNLSKVKDTKLENINRVAIAQLNINSLQIKFGFLMEKVTGYVDKLLFSQSNLYNSFHNCSVSNK